VFECVDQSARSLAAALDDVIVTSREGGNEARLSQWYEKGRYHKRGGDTIEKVVSDDLNNSSILLGIINLVSSC